jgi:hypothetical protein
MPGLVAFQRETILSPVGPPILPASIFIAPVQFDFGRILRCRRPLDAPFTIRCFRPFLSTAQCKYLNGPDPVKITAWQT